MMIRIRPCPLRTGAFLSLKVRVTGNVQTLSIEMRERLQSVKESFVSMVFHQIRRVIMPNLKDFIIKYRQVSREEDQKILDGTSKTWSPGFMFGCLAVIGLAIIIFGKGCLYVIRSS